MTASDQPPSGSPRPLSAEDPEAFFRDRLPELCNPSADDAVMAAITSAHGIKFMLATMAANYRLAVTRTLGDLSESTEDSTKDDVVGLEAEDILAILLPVLAAVPDFPGVLGLLHDHLLRAAQEDRVFSLDAFRRDADMEAIRKEGRGAVNNAGVSLRQMISLLEPAVQGVRDVLSEHLFWVMLTNSRVQVEKVCTRPTPWTQPAGGARSLPAADS